MFNLIKFISVFLLPLTAAAVSPSGVPSITLGGYASQLASSPYSPGGIVVPASDTSYFTLYAGSMSGTNTYVMPFRKNGVIYQVTAGKTCRCDWINYRVGGASQGFQLMSATVTFANNADPAGLTGAVWQNGASNVYSMAGHTTANTQVTQGTQYVFAASTYPGFQQEINAQLYHVSLICREVP